MVPARVINELFTQKVASAEGRDKIAEYGGNYIRDKLREVSFARMILPPIHVTRQDCQISVNHDTLVKLEFIEPKSRAMTISFRGQPEANFIRGEKAEIAFFTISSQIFEKNEQELLAYPYPITKVIEENSVKDLQEVEDREYTIHIEAAVQALQQEANGGTATSLDWTHLNAGTVVEFSICKGELARTAGVDDATPRPVQRPDLVRLFKLLDGNRLKSERLLMTEVDWDDLLGWTVEDWGDRLQSETAVEGYKYNVIMGRSYIRTIKTDILRIGNIYCFTAPEFLGKNYILNNTKFYIDKVANLITWQSWMDIAINISNVASIVKLELYSGSVTPTAETTGFAAKLPLDEDQLGAVNNRVDQGLKYPDVSQF